MEIDIKGLTQEAESGHGCAVESVLNTLKFDESIKVIKEIAGQNARNRQANPDSPVVYMQSDGNAATAAAYLNLKGAKEWGSGNELVRDQMTIGDFGSSDGKVGDRRLTCSDLTWKK